MTAAALVAELRARGVSLRPDGDVLCVRPVSKVTPQELAALKAHKAEVLALLTRPPALRLDAAIVRATLGDSPDPHALASLRFDVLAAVAYLEAEIRTGTIGQHPLLVRGRPLADWLSLDDLARLLRAGKAQP